MMINKKLSQARAKLGLPSSVIKDTDPVKARQFFGSLGPTAVLRVLLLWVAGDGHLVFRPTTTKAGRILLKLEAIMFAARDDNILPIFKESLQLHGLAPNCPDSFKRPDCNRLRLPLQKGDNALNRTILEALSSAPVAIFHPKLVFLENFLKSSDLCLPLSQFSSKLPFYEYIENDLSDKLLWVLAQDFHSLNMHAINAILSFAGFPQIASIQDFNLKQFKEDALKLEAKTTEQKVLADYIQSCKKRVIETGVPINVVPNTFELRCDFPGCSFVTARKDSLTRHKKTHSANVMEFHCDFPGCTFITKHSNSLAKHKKTHDPSAKKFPCTYEGSSRVYQSLKTAGCNPPPNCGEKVDLRFAVGLPD